MSRQTPTRSKWPVRRISRMCSGEVTSFWRFSMRIRTPRGGAKALRCSLAGGEVWGDVAGPLAAAPVGKVDGLMECGGYAGRAEPGGDVADGGAVGVVEVVAGGEQFDCGRTGFVEGVEQARGQTLLEEDMGGDGGLHHLLRYSRGGAGVSARIGTL